VLQNADAGLDVDLDGFQRKPQIDPRPENRYFTHAAFPPWRVIIVEW
jgi:hypothetical protein